MGGMTWDDARVRRLRDLHGQMPRLSYAEIAATLGCSRNAVAGAVNKYIYGHMTPQPVDSPRENAQ